MQKIVLRPAVFVMFNMQLSGTTAGGTLLFVLLTAPNYVAAGNIKQRLQVFGNLSLSSSFWKYHMANKLINIV